MAFNTGLKTSRRGGGLSSTTATPSGLYGRVVDVIMDAFHPKYNDYGKSQSLNGVFYRPLNAAREEGEDQDLSFAYCGNPNIRRVPLKGEIIDLISQPSENREGRPKAQKKYWMTISPLWNHPHHNAYPDTIQFDDQESQADLGEYFEEVDKVNPLQLFPGDISIEGRHGQSIRMTGTKFDSNEWIDDSNNGQPLTILKNGQKEVGTGDEAIIESINEDKSSIYLTSDHTIDLEQANIKRDAWSEEPEEANKFKGAQVIINSGRLYFNAYDEHALFSAKEGIGLNAKTVSLDGEEYVGLDAKKIYLGVAALKREQEPVLKGETTALWLEDWLSQFEQLVKGMATAPPSPPVFVAKVIALCNAILPIIPILKNRIPNLKSKKVFTE